MEIAESNGSSAEEQRRRGMDRPARPGRWPWSRSPRGARLAALALCSVLIAGLLIAWIVSSDVRTLRIPFDQVSYATAEQSEFHDLIPLKANVVPRDTVYIDATDGGRVDRVLVQAGDVVEEGQPLLTMSNNNLALEVIQQEAQLNQAISQLQQNEIALEQNQLTNERSLADIDYNLVRLTRASSRRNDLAARGLLAAEERDSAADELAYYQKIKPIQMESGQRQTRLREQLLPEIRRQLQILRGNLAVVHNKLDGLVVRAPVAGRVTALDLKVGENRNPGQRLAEVTPDTGMKLTADIDEFYLPRVHVGEVARISLNGNSVLLRVKRVSPQVRNGQFQIDLDLTGADSGTLVQGATAQGHLQLGEDTPALILPAGAFLDRTGGNWCFVVSADERSAERRPIQSGRRTSEQVEIIKGLNPGDKVITSDYTGLDRVDRLVLTR